MMWMSACAAAALHLRRLRVFLILILAVFSILSMRRILPNIEFRGHRGCNTPACRRRRCRRAIVLQQRTAMTTTVNDIEHIESQSLNGIAIIKIFFKPP